MKKCNLLMLSLLSINLYSSQGKLYRNLLGQALRAGKVNYTNQLIIPAALETTIKSDPYYQKSLHSFLEEIRHPHMNRKNLETYKDLIQARKTAPIIVDYKDPVIGYGVFALNKIPSGAFIGEYTGKVNTLKTEADDTYAWQNWILTQANSGKVINFQDIQNDDKLDPYFVDAKTCGNELRFVNDNGSQSNCIADIVVGHDKLPHVYYIAAHDIQAGQELSIQYGENYWKQHARKRLDLHQN